MIRMKKYYSFVFLGFFVFLMGGCSSAEAPKEKIESKPLFIPYKTFLVNNRSNIQKIKLGMKRSEVINLMGTMGSKVGSGPLSTPTYKESYKYGADDFEVLFYLTQKYPTFRPIKKNQATPIILQNGFVTGVGWNKYARLGEGATLPLKLYNLSNGSVLKGNLVWGGISGSISLNFNKKTECNGEYFTVNSGISSASWGKIYGVSSASIFRNTEVNVDATGGTVQQSLTSLGTAIMSCTDKSVLECEYTVDNTRNKGSGYCTKNKVRYRMTF